jgi:hypothetical protein
VNSFSPHRWPPNVRTDHAEAGKIGMFFKNVLGLEESGRKGLSIYFRGWGEFFHHSLQLTEGPAPAISHTGWRTEGPQELETCVKRLTAAGCGIGWQKPTVGHGSAYRFRAHASSLGRRSFTYRAE